MGKENKKRYYETFYKEKDWKNSYTSVKLLVKAYLHLISLFSNRKIKKVLDVGCGTGDFSRAFSELEYKVTGIDFASSAINKAREKYPDLVFIEDDATSLKLKESYDLLFVSGFSPFNIENNSVTKSIIEHWAGFLNQKGIIFILGRTNLQGQASSSGWFFHTERQTVEMFYTKTFNGYTFYSLPIFRYLLLSPLLKKSVLSLINNVSKALALQYNIPVRSMTILIKK